MQRDAAGNTSVVVSLARFWSVCEIFADKIDLSVHLANNVFGYAYDLWLCSEAR